MEGMCLCKAVSVKVTDDKLFTQRRGHVCHCANCRKVSGSGRFFYHNEMISVCTDIHECMGATNLIIETEKVEFAGEGNLRCYDDYDTLSGKPVHRYFCQTCGV